VATVLGWPGVQSASSLPGACRHVQAGGRAWMIDEAGNQDALLAASDALSAFPFGLMLWESSLALADDLAHRHDPVRQGRVLELGAGVGLAGLAAAALSMEALALCRYNAALNGITGIDVRHGDWTAWTDETVYSTVIGSDVLYDEHLLDAVYGVLVRTVEPGGRALLSDPGRSTCPPFVARLSRSGWHVVQRETDVPTLVPVRNGDRVRVTIVEANRPG
jgi:methyltransferase-like protein 23